MMTMVRSATRQAAAGLQKMKARTEQMVGRVTGDEGLRARAVLDHTKAGVKRAGTRLRGAGERAAHKSPARVRWPRHAWVRGPLR